MLDINCSGLGLCQTHACKYACPLEVIVTVCCIASEGFMQLEQELLAVHKVSAWSLMINRKGGEPCWQVVSK